MYDRIHWDARMIGLLGPRGVGKTPLVLQHIKEQLPRRASLYVEAEDFYFASHRLLDLADEFARMGESISLSTRYTNTQTGRGS